MDNNGIIIPHPHSHPPGMRLFPRICLNAAGTLKMIIYLLNVGDTRGEQCSPLIGPLSPYSASDWPEVRPAQRSPTLAAGHRKICGDLDALLPTSLSGISECPWHSRLSLVSPPPSLASDWPMAKMHVSSTSWCPVRHPSPHHSAHVREMTQNNPSPGQ